MKSIIAALVFITAAGATAAVNQDEILNWRQTPGITEAEAAKLAREGIINFLTWDDEGEYCTAEEFWGFEYDEANVVSKKPAFAVTGYARGPNDHCGGYTNYDCRVVITQDEKGKWSEYFTDCEPTTLHDGD